MTQRPTDPEIGDEIPDHTIYVGDKMPPGTSTEPKIGDKMSDGTIFAGVSPATGKPMFISPDDGYPSFTRYMEAHPRISRFLNEHPKTYRFLLHVAHHIPVIKNQIPSVPRIGCSFNEAQKYANKLDAHGHKDWRVPTAGELNALFNNRSALGGFNQTGTSPEGWYWSKTLAPPPGTAWDQRFSDGLRNFDVVNKKGITSVLCIRHEPKADPQEVQTPTTPKP